jgi:LytR cell envelope-related transcriptional attenuator
MASIPLALSIHNFINKVGADAGFASIIGLAILVLLYFAQARETATLRRHAAEAAERIQQLEGRISQVLRAQAAASAAAAPPAQAAAGPIIASRGVGTAVHPGVAAGFRTLVPAAPAGVGAPALTAATRLIPTPGFGAPEPVSPLAAVAPGGPVALQEFDTGAAPPPATVAGAANGHAREPLTDFGGVPAPVPAPSGPAQPPPRVHIRPGQAPIPSRRPTGVPRPAAGGTQAGPSRRILAAGVGALVVAAVVIGLLALTSGGTAGKAKTNTVPASNAPARGRRAQTVAINPAKVTVAVLNGTATAQLANRVGALLTGAGYQKGMITNAPDQTHTATVVAYLPTFKRDALAVAKSLKLKTSSVQAIDQNTQAVACPAAPAPCTANVVVTVGADLAGTQ